MIQGVESLDIPDCKVVPAFSPLRDALELIVHASLPANIDIAGRYSVEGMDDDTYDQITRWIAENCPLQWGGCEWVVEAACMAVRDAVSHCSIPDYQADS